MLIDRDDIRNNVTTIPLACFFSMFVYICDRFCFVLIGGNLTAQLLGSDREIGGRIKIPEMQLQALLFFPAPPQERPRELACGPIPGMPYSRRSRWLDIENFTS